MDNSDVLSNVLQGVQIRSLDVEEVAFSSPWNIRGGQGAAYFYCLLHGECRYEIEGREAVGKLASGDLLVLLRERRHVLHDGSANWTMPQRPTFEPSEPKMPFQQFCSSPCAAKLICGRFQFDERGIGPLLSLLPPHIHLPGIDGQVAPWLADTLRHILRESAPDRPGSHAIVDRLSQIIFIEAIRSCMHAHQAHDGRLLAGLMDPDIGPILEIIHKRPEHPWTVASLAGEVGMSRSVFASRFKEVLSVTPFQYLLDCRMKRACDLLVEDRHGIKRIASLSGYATEAAFTNAFKRWCGQTPGTYRRMTQGNLASSNNKPHGSGKIAVVR
jgi:AraC-like DNA-binding protein